MERQILLLGDPRLYETSEEVTLGRAGRTAACFTDMLTASKASAAITVLGGRSQPHRSAFRSA